MRKLLLYHVPFNILFILKCRFEKYRGYFVVCVGATSTEATLKSVFSLSMYVWDIYSKSLTADTVLTSALGPW